MSVPSITLRFFGGFRLEVRQLEVPNVPRPVQELLAILVMSGEAGVERNVLARTIWPDAEAERARFYLRRSLTQLRALLGPEKDRLVAKDESRVALLAENGRFDVVEFWKKIVREDEESLHQAVLLSPGPFLPGVRSDWVRNKRQMFREKLAHGLCTLSSFAEQRDDHEKAREWLRRAIEEDPIREDTVRQLMRLYAHRGNFAAIVRTLKDVRQRLQRHLGLPPSPETIQLYRELMSEAELVDPAQSFKNAPALLAVGIPTPITPFLGRSRERAAVAEAVLSNRLVTLSGFGGVGKSRIAIEVARDLSDKFESIAFADLSTCARHEEVSGRIARSLGFSDLAAEDLGDQVASQLGPRSCLLVLDGIEQFTAECAELLEQALPNCPRLHVLSTSQVLLLMADEHVIPLAPLEVVPSGGNEDLALQVEAVSFFLARAMQAVPTFRITPNNRADIVEICRRLDGLPLALELAAVRLRSMPPDEILSRLDDRFEFLERSSGAHTRRRTLQAVLDVSYRLLTNDESILFSRLSVFPASFSAQAAQAVCGSEGFPAGRIPILLSNLVDHSLVEYAPESLDGRYRMLETVRTYARDRLRETNGIDHYEDRHAEHYLKIAASFENDPACTERFRLNEPNFAHAIQRLVSGKDRSSRLLAARLVNRLFPYWGHTGNLSGGIATALLVIEECGPGPDDSLSECLLRAGGAAHILYNLPLADDLFTRAQKMADELGLDSWSADAVRGRGEVASNFGRLDDAVKILSDALARSKQLGDEVGQAQCLGTLGYVAREQLRLDDARRLTEEAISLYTQSGDSEGRLWCAGSLGSIYLNAGQPELAVPLFQETLAHQERLDNKLAQAWNLTNLGICSRRLGRYEEAETYLRRAMECRDVGDNDLSKGWPLLELGHVQRLTSRLDEAEETVGKALELARVSRGLSEAEALRSMGLIYIARGDLITARAYRSMVAKVAKTIQSAQFEKDLADFDSTLSRHEQS